MSHITSGETGLISSAIAALAIATTWWTTSRSIKLQRKSSQDDWLRNQRAGIYIDLLKVARTLHDQAVVSVFDAQSSGWPSDKDIDTSDLQARVTAFASKEIASLYTKYFGSLRSFKQIRKSDRQAGFESQKAGVTSIQTAIGDLTAIFETLCKRISQELQSLPDLSS